MVKLSTVPGGLLALFLVRLDFDYFAFFLAAGASLTYCVTFVRLSYPLGFQNIRRIIQKKERSKFDFPRLHPAFWPVSIALLICSFFLLGSLRAAPYLGIASSDLNQEGVTLISLIIELGGLLGSICAHRISDFNARIISFFAVLSAVFIIGLLSFVEFPLVFCIFILAIGAISSAVQIAAKSLILSREDVSEIAVIDATIFYSFMINIVPIFGSYAIIQLHYIR
jgi:hypothetical protein